MWFSKRPKVDQELYERLGKLDRKILELELEWNNVLGKIRTMMGRISKRAEIVEKAEGQDGLQAGGPDGPGPEPSWLANMDPVSRSILERRGQIPKRR